MNRRTLKILNFNFKAGQELPIHSHDIDGQMEYCRYWRARGFFGKDNVRIPAAPGDVLISDISEPHRHRRRYRPSGAGDHCPAHLAGC
ncbi:MAG: hypothetical protein R2861_09470 [Desulfobacterales bacterium]